MIVDTGPLVAALNRRDANHRLAVRVLQDAGASARIPEAVLVEVDHLTRPLAPTRPPVLALLDALAVGDHTFQEAGLDVLEAAALIDRQYADLQLGLTDCVVMALAHRLRQQVFTFEFRDFRAVTVGGQALELVVGEDEVQ